MLVLGRKEGQAIVIQLEDGRIIKIVVTRIEIPEEEGGDGNVARPKIAGIGIDADRSIIVDREEVYEKKKASAKKKKEEEQEGGDGA
jgi:sRNA-binding carbon storage regulator CsrA